MRNPVRARRLAAAVSLALISACATNPATGKKQIMLVGEAQEIAMGQEADKEVASSLGLYPDEALQAYVASLGKELAAKGERPSLPWTFRVVDDPTVNAFALPGGFIYVTRGILTHLNSEAELASVIGHEIGHVTARHTVSQITKSQLATLGLVAGMIVRPELAQLRGSRPGRMQLMFLKFGRNDEQQADDLGPALHDAGELRPAGDGRGVLRARPPGAGERRGPLARLALHPSRPRQPRPAHPVRDPGPAASAATRVEEPGYLQRVDGMVFGENPREGSSRAAASSTRSCAFSSASRRAGRPRTRGRPSAPSAPRRTRSSS